MASMEITDVRKSFGAVEVVHGVSVAIDDGEFVVLVGPSGCGKSTLLRMIAGLEEISAGEISIAGRVVNQLRPKERDIAMVFQNYALYPHMNVARNMGFSLMLRGERKEVIERKVKEAAAILGLEQYLDRYPRQLSGGQRQRVAMGRSIVRDPQVFLFDEPLSNLDAKLRVQMRAEIKDLHLRLKTTVIYVTHDQIEAMTMADKIVVLRDGVVEQIGKPLDLYDRPANLFVAGFIGSPAMNILQGTIVQARQGAGLRPGRGHRPAAAAGRVGDRRPGGPLWHPTRAFRALRDRPCRRGVADRADRLGDASVHAPGRIRPARRVPGTGASRSRRHARPGGAAERHAPFRCRHRQAHRAGCAPLTGCAPGFGPANARPGPRGDAAAGSPCLI